jgi:hypothetical protein
MMAMSGQDFEILSRTLEEDGSIKIGKVAGPDKVYTLIDDQAS